MEEFDILDNLELYEEREKELLVELGKLNPDDPKRVPIVKELETIAKIRSTYQENEERRLNNNAVNDINEQRLIIDQQKAENERKKNNLTAIQTGLYVGAGVGSYIASYYMEDIRVGFRSAIDWGKAFINKIIR